MASADLQAILRDVLSGARDPIVAADDILAGGELMLGGVGADMGEIAANEGLRFQALMGRLMWVTLRGGGAPELPQPDGLAAYRDFFLAAIAAEGGPADPSDR